MNIWGKKKLEIEKFYKFLQIHLKKLIIISPLLNLLLMILKDIQEIRIFHRVHFIVLLVEKSLYQVFQ